jgi:hypothetical protein
MSDESHNHRAAPHEPETMNEERPLTPAQKARERIYAIIAISLVVMFLACSGLITALELPSRLLLGWIVHLGNTLPVLYPQWHKLLLPLGCLALATWLVHHFIRWWISAKDSAIHWRARHTISATLLVLLGSAAAIALSGVVHQAVWLFDAPWWVNRGRFAIRSEATNNIRQLHLAILDFETEHGRYPDSLAEVKTNPKLLHLSPDRGEPPEPILYLKPREAPVHSDPNEDIAILVSPLLGSDREWIVVGFTSGAAKTMLRQQLPEILETRRMPTLKKP